MLTWCTFQISPLRIIISLEYNHMVDSYFPSAEEIEKSTVKFIDLNNFFSEVEFDSCLKSGNKKGERRILGQSHIISGTNSMRSREVMQVVAKRVAQQKIREDSALDEEGTKDGGERCEG